MSSSCNNNNYHKRISSNNQIPAKKKYLVKGQANFRPPLERSKSAPRLTSIDELQEDEESPGHDEDDANGRMAHPSGEVLGRGQSVQVEDVSDDGH